MNRIPVKVTLRAQGNDKNEGCNIFIAKDLPIFWDVEGFFLRFWKILLLWKITLASYCLHKHKVPPKGLLKRLKCNRVPSNIPVTGGFSFCKMSLEFHSL